MDTPAFISFIERHPTHVDVLRRLFQRVDAGSLRAFGAVVTLTEVLTKPIQQGDVALQNEYRALLLTSRNFTLLPITAAIAERAAHLRARFRLPTPDALQLATALEARCEAFITNDVDLRRVTDVRVLVISELEG